MFSSKIRSKRRILFLPHVVNIVVEVLARIIRPEKEKSPSKLEKIKPIYVDRKYNLEYIKS